MTIDTKKPPTERLAFDEWGHALNLAALDPNVDRVLMRLKAAEDEIDTLRAQLAEAHAAVAEATRVAQGREAQIAALRALKTINLDEAKRILEEVRTGEDVALACNRAITVAVLAVKDLAAVDAIIRGGA